MLLVIARSPSLILLFFLTPIVTSSSRRLARESRILETRWHIWRHHIHGKRETSPKSWGWRGDTYVIIPTPSLVIVVIIRAFVALFAMGFMGVMGRPRTFCAARICRETFADGYIQEFSQYNVRQRTRRQFRNIWVVREGGVSVGDREEGKCNKFG